MSKSLPPWMLAPEGTRDVFPDEQETRVALENTLMEQAARWGYRRVGTPLFEYEWVASRGLAFEVGGAPLRFVESGSDKVAVLRPDVTPQLVRVLHRLRHECPPPWRLAYAATLFRRPHGRARQARQSAQIGFEHVGPDPSSADLELVTLLLQLLKRVGVRAPTLELAWPSWTESLLNAAFPDATLRADALSLLRVRDTGALNRMKAQASRPDAVDALLHAVQSVLDTPTALAGVFDGPFQGPESARAVAGIRGLFESVSRLWPECRVIFDAGESYGLGYYRGLSFAVHAGTSDEPLARGGRYDGAYEDLGLVEPASGFGIRLEALQHALGQTPRQMPASPRIGWLGTAPEAWAGALRDQGVACVTLPDSLSAQALTTKAAYEHLDGVIEGVRDGVWRLRSAASVATSGATSGAASKGAAVEFRDLPTLEAAVATLQT